MFVSLVIRSSINDSDFKKRFISSDNFQSELLITTKYEVKNISLKNFKFKFLIKIICI
jgi:hypothetical protein